MSITFPDIAPTAVRLTTGTVNSGEASPCRHPFAQQIVGLDLCGTKADVLNQVRVAQGNLEAWRIRQNRDRSHSASERFSPELLRPVRKAD